MSGGCLFVVACILAGDLWCLLLFVWFVLCLGVYVLLFFGYVLFGVYGVFCAGLV